MLEPFLHRSSTNSPYSVYIQFSTVLIEYVTSIDLLCTSEGGAPDISNVVDRKQLMKGITTCNDQVVCAL